MKKGVLLLSVWMACFSAFAQSSEEATVLNALKKLDVTGKSVKPSPVPGIKTVFTDKGVLYVTTDGKYILHGAMYDISGPYPTNVANQYLMEEVEKQQANMIVYPAAKEKHVVTIFTDIHCGYCRKLHKEMKSYNEAGITVRYLAFPREGMESKTAKEMQSIWCTKERNKAFDAAIRGDEISPATCKVDIRQQFELGVQFGVQGTPAILLNDGMLIPGYMEAKDMLNMLDGQPEAEAADKK